jgi:hypothetical protein
MRGIVRLAVGGLLVLGLLVPAVTASAKQGDVIERGGCTSAATWKLKASPDNGKIEVEFEVDSNKVGLTWRVRMFRDGTKIFDALRVTKAPSGSFEARRLTANPAGPDTIKARARNVKSGAVCAGSLVFRA